MHLNQLPLGRPAFIDKVDWDQLSRGEAQRLREFGVSEGVSVENLHRAGLFGHGALACRIGRMTVAMRRAHAEAIHVRAEARADTGADTGDAPLIAPPAPASPADTATRTDRKSAQA